MSKLCMGWTNKPNEEALHWGCEPFIRLDNSLVS